MARFYCNGITVEAEDETEAAIQFAARANHRRNGALARGIEVRKEGTVKGGGHWEFRALLDTVSYLDVVFLYISRINADAPLSPALAA